MRIARPPVEHQVQAVEDAELNTSDQACRARGQRDTRLLERRSAAHAVTRALEHLGKRDERRGIRMDEQHARSRGTASSPSDFREVARPRVRAGLYIVFACRRKEDFSFTATQS